MVETRWNCCVGGGHQESVIHYYIVVVVAVEKGLDDGYYHQVAIPCPSVWLSFLGGWRRILMSAKEYYIISLHVYYEVYSNGEEYVAGITLALK